MTFIWCETCANTLSWIPGNCMNKWLTFLALLACPGASVTCTVRGQQPEKISHSLCLRYAQLCFYVWAGFANSRAVWHEFTSSLDLGLWPGLLTLLSPGALGYWVQKSPHTHSRSHKCLAELAGLSLGQAARPGLAAFAVNLVNRQNTPWTRIFKAFPLSRTSQLPSPLRAEQ